MTSLLSRRAFATISAAAPLALSARTGRKVPIGLELYSVRNELKQDLPGTLRAVSRMGYEGVEFFAPYFEWTVERAHEVRKLLDELNLRCYSTHNSASSLAAENLPHAIDLNRALGSKFIVMASAGKVDSLDSWKAVAETLNRAAEKTRPVGIRTGYHNHQLEFTPVEGRRPIEVIAANTGKDVMLQLDVGTCLEAGSDPVAWIEQNPGRIRSLHCKDWSPAKGYHVLLGEGTAPWKKIVDAAEKTGGVEYYLIEQEGSDVPPLETAQRCLAAFRKLRNA